MSKYLEEYTVTLGVLSKIKQRTKKNHSSHYPILDEMLGFQYYLNNEFSKFYNSQDPIELKKYKSELFVHILFDYNTRSLQSALNDIECDRIHQAAVNIRTVYESIPKMYYLALFPEETEFIMVHEHIIGMHLEQVLKEIKGEDCIKYLDGKELTITTKNELNKFNKKYSHRGFLKILYSKKRLESIKELYSKLSNSTHPNITRYRRSTEYDFETTEYFFKLLVDLSYFNIHAHLEGSVELLKEIEIDQEILDFLSEKSKQHEGFSEEVYFVPDNENLERKLKTKFKT